MTDAATTPDHVDGSPLRVDSDLASSDVAGADSSGRQTVTGGAQNAPDSYPSDANGWRRLEYEQKERELKQTSSASKRQLWATAIAALTVAAAIASTLVAYTSSRAASDAAVRQQKGSLLAAAISALGGAKPAERIAGLSILIGEASDALVEAKETGTTEDRVAARTEFRNAIVTVVNYLREPPNPNVNTQYPAQTLGVGFPKVQPENQYAANGLKQLLGMTVDPRFGIDGEGGIAAVDLSTTQLYGQSWSDIDFSRMSSTYIFGADLRAANLTRSKFPNATLSGSFLRCANLEGADLTNADLSNVDLRGANLRGSTFRSARNASTARLDGAIMPEEDPAKPWDKAACLREMAASDNPVAPPTVPPPSTIAGPLPPR